MRSPSARLLLPLAFAFLVWPEGAANSARAGFVVAVQSVSAAAGSTNDTLQVTLKNTGTSAVTVGGFAFEIIAGTGVTFTAVDISTTPAYIFAGHSLFGPDISNQPPNLPGTTLEAEDNYDIANSGISLAAGATVGLGDVHFNVSAGVTGPITISMVGFPTSNISNATGVDITQSVGTTFNGGMVTVSSATVPEPASLVMLSTALLGTSLIARALRRRAGGTSRPATRV